MVKVKITQQQYNAILIHESQIRLKKSENVISEVLNEDTHLLEEGWKEVVLGVAMMMGIGLTGMNKAIAQDAVTNTNTMAQIKSTLEDSEKTKQLVDLLKEKGMKDPETKLAQNAEKVMDEFNKIAANDNIKYRVDTKVVNNLQGLKSKLGQGYALKNADIGTDTVQTAPTETITTIVTDTIEVDLGTDNLFVTGGYTLSPAGVDTITIALDEIKKQGGKVISAYIESSTDAEEIIKFKSSTDPTGNIRLAELRTKSVADLIGNQEQGISITHREIPNNGANVVSTKDFLKVAKNKNATAQLREKTADYRYVKIKIIATFTAPDTTTNQPPANIIQNYRFELVKVIDNAGKTRKITTKTHFKHKEFKCKKQKKHGKINVDACTTF